MAHIKTVYLKKLLYVADIIYVNQGKKEFVVEEIRLVNGVGTTADGKYKFTYRGDVIGMTEATNGNPHMIVSTMGNHLIRPDNLELVQIIL